MGKRYYRVPESRRSFGLRTWGLIGLGVLIVISVILMASFLRPDKPQKQIQATEEVQQLPSAPAKESVEGRYLFNGTIVLARAVERAALVNGQYDYNQPFSQLHTLKPELYDGWLADLECPITTNNVSYQQQIDNLVFNCRPEWLPSFSKHFGFVNLANNHTSDMGRDGFLETQRHLDAAGIQIVGNYDSSISKDTCEVMALPVRIMAHDGTTTKGSLPVAFCAWHYFFRRPRAGELEVMERYAKTMPVFSFMHVGVEYLPKAGEDQVNIARQLIDLGSEFVIGNSPHWVQNAEVYKGKLIAYSTGNFIFDQIDSETMRGLSIDARFNVKHDDNLAKWLALGEQCKARGDNCLELAQQQSLAKIKLELTYEPVASSGGARKLTTKATDAVQKAVEERLGWPSIKQQLAL